MLQMSLEVYLQFINYAREQGMVEQPWVMTNQNMKRECLEAT